MHARVLSSKQLFTSLLSLKCSPTAVGDRVVTHCHCHSLQWVEQFFSNKCLTTRAVLARTSTEILICEGNNCKCVASVKI